MHYRVRGLDPRSFRPLFDLAEDALQAQSARMLVADDSTPGFPCRVSLAHAAPGERLLLVNFEHQPAASPYRSRHAIYVAEGSKAAFDGVDELPEPLRVRTLSIRSFDADGMMIDADVVDGATPEPLIRRMLADRNAAYLHAHFAKRGCYAARIERAN